jgi:hypothetical protein
MTTHSQPTAGRPAPPRLREPLGIPYAYRDHTVVGTAAQLANIVDNHRNAGTLVAMTAPRPVGDRFQILIRLREPRPARPTPRVTTIGEPAYTRIRRPRRGARVAVIVTAITGTAAGLVAVAAYLLGQLVEFIAAHAGQILGVLALTAVIAGLAARRGSSGRRHCPGC